jgi:hypothetical protein
MPSIPSIPINFWTAGGVAGGVGNGSGGLPFMGEDGPGRLPSGWDPDMPTDVWPPGVYPPASVSGKYWFYDTALASSNLDKYGGQALSQGGVGSEAVEDDYWQAQGGSDVYTNNTFAFAEPRQPANDTRVNGRINVHMMLWFRTEFTAASSTEIGEIAADFCYDNATDPKRTILFRYINSELRLCLCDDGNYQSVLGSIQLEGAPLTIHVIKVNVSSETDTDAGTITTRFYFNDTLVYTDTRPSLAQDSNSRLAVVTQTHFFDPGFNYSECRIKDLYAFSEEL